MTGEHHQRKARHLARVRRLQVARTAGLLTMLLGYGLLAVYPDTPLNWALLRVVLGFTCLFIGFGLAIVPWLDRILSGDKE